jgi:hypothetical protein
MGRGREGGKDPACRIQAIDRFIGMQAGRQLTKGDHPQGEGSQQRPKQR